VKVEGVIDVWGAQAAQPLVRRWELQFRQDHPAFHVLYHMTGSDIGMAGLYTGFADLAVLGRECTAVENKAFEWIFRYPPTQIQIMTGSLGQAGRSPALIAYVHRENPLARLTLAQLNAVFGHEHASGAVQNIRTWGGLGLEGEWTSQPINLYANHAESGTGAFFRQIVLKGSAKMNWDALREFSGHDASSRILAAVAADRAGLAVTAGWGKSMPSQVRSVPIGRDESEAVAASRESLIARRYPLARSVHVYFNRAPSRPLDVRIELFLRYILGDRGQREVVDQGDYLPLTPQTADQQLQQLA
jgi:phosphate transport system substrate-binding protein